MVEQNFIRTVKLVKHISAVYDVITHVKSNFRGSPKKRGLSHAGLLFNTLGVKHRLEPDR